MKEDTGLSELRVEFVASFAERKAELDARLAEFTRLRSEGRHAHAHEACLAIHVVAHRLAGAAATYGLKALGSIAEALDDILAEELRGNHPSGASLDLLPSRAAILSIALGEAFASKGDSPVAAATPEAKKLISDAGSLLSEASS